MILRFLCGIGLTLVLSVAYTCWKIDRVLAFYDAVHSTKRG